MKKSYVILSLTLLLLSLSAYAITRWQSLETDTVKPSLEKDIAQHTQASKKNKIDIFSGFIYDIGPRFRAIKKKDVEKARTIGAFIDRTALEKIVYLKSVSVSILINDKPSDIREIGFSKELTPLQLQLLQSADYSTDFLIRTEFQQKNEETNTLEPSYYSPHLTIVPETQATYSLGKDVLMKYFKSNTEAAREHVDPTKFQAAKLLFTVSKNGTIKNVHLDRSSGYPSVDETMIQLIHKTPGTWNPAENATGEKVDQQLVVSFGMMGC